MKLTLLNEDFTWTDFEGKVYTFKNPDEFNGFMQSLHLLNKKDAQIQQSQKQLYDKSLQLGRIEAQKQMDWDAANSDHNTANPKVFKRFQLQRAQERQEAANKAGIGTIGDFRKSENADAQKMFKMQHDVQLQSDFDATNPNDVRNKPTLASLSPLFSKLYNDKKQMEDDMQTALDSAVDQRDAAIKERDSIIAQRNTDINSAVQPIKSFRDSLIDSIRIGLERIQTLKTEKSKLNTEITELRSDLETVDKQLTEAYSNLNNARTDNEVFKIQIQQLESEKTTLQTKLDAATLNAQNITKEKNDLQSQYDATKKELDELKTKAPNLWDAIVANKWQAAGLAIGTLLVGYGCYKLFQKYKQWKQSKEV